jgi:co-chaperonin GroES (HSP10)
MPIDVSVKNLAEKHAKDAATSIAWQPVGRRIKIEPDPETRSAIIHLDKVKDLFVRGTILAVGPVAGLSDDGTTRLEQYKPGQKIIYNKNTELSYTGADGVKHYFLKSDEVTSIIAVEGTTALEGAE